MFKEYRYRKHIRVFNKILPTTLIYLITEIKFGSKMINILIVEVIKNEIEYESKVY